MSTADLPLPDAGALAASDALCARIADRLESLGGWMGFDAWMEMALYEPGLGYYSGGARKFGPDGDFVTAPEISPLFGACVARQCAQWFAHAPPRIHEFGAGSGALAADLLVTLERLGCPVAEYRIIEVSGELRARQRATIAARAPASIDRVQWLDAWPTRMSGVVLGNELLDAMPARLFRRVGGDIRERGVALRDGGAPAFRWSERDADPAFAARVRARLAPLIEAAGDWWPADYASEIGERALAWVREAAGRIDHGALLLFDYGFPAREFYHPQRSLGTLMCHYRHRAHGDPFLWPGLQDITAHVDFSAIADAACDAGLDLLGYASQAHFLLSSGLLDCLSAPATPDAAHFRQSRAVQTLVSEAEMGELFKAIAFGRGMPPDSIGFLRADRSASL